MKSAYQEFLEAFVPIEESEVIETKPCPHECALCGEHFQTTEEV